MSLNLACLWQGPGQSCGATLPTNAPEGLAWMEGQPPRRDRSTQSSATHPLTQSLQVGTSELTQTDMATLPVSGCGRRGHKP